MCKMFRTKKKSVNMLCVVLVHGDYRFYARVVKVLQSQFFKDY